METQDNTPAQSDKVIKANAAGAKVRKWLTVIAVIVVALIFFGQKVMMGTRYKVTDKESVNYSEKATEADAKKLGDILKANGFFDGSKEVDVLLKMGGKEGTVISFVLNAKWSDEGTVKFFRTLGEDIAGKGFGKPLTVRLIEGKKLNTKNEFKIE